jgi:hypothetical protein
MARIRHRGLLLAPLALVLVAAACANRNDPGGTVGGSVSASCAAPYLDAVPPTAPSASAATPVSPGDRLTIYGHWYTSTCNDTGNDTGASNPLEPLPPVHLTLTLPGGEVTDLGRFTPAGDDMGFSVVVEVPAGTPAGLATVRDDQEHPATYTFHVKK